MSRPFRVGLTGGVGSGKSTVADMLASMGASVIDTDVIARSLTASGGAALPAIVARFGEAMLAPDGALDRGMMRDRVFSDPAGRQALEAILHPLIRAQVQHQCDKATGAYVLVVVPLLIENLAEYRSVLDRILVVDCLPEQQLVRTSARPGLNEAMARAIMAAQIDRAARLAAADDVISNQGDLTALRQAITDLHSRYATWAAKKM